MTDKFKSFQSGMPVTMEAMKTKAAGFDFQSLIDHSVENTNVCTISNSSGQVLQTVPVLGEDIPFMDPDLIKARGWHINISPTNGHRFSALTGSYWNCICKKNNIHHKIVGRCPVCKKNSTVKQMAYVEDILHDYLQWEFIVGGNKVEYTKEKIDRMFKDYGMMIVTFTKSDGSKRVMKCTKDLENVPEEFHPKISRDGKKSRKQNPLLCNVFEIGVGWRSFYYAKVESVEYSNVG